MSSHSTVERHVSEGAAVHAAKRAFIQAPVHEHRDWRHLQRAAVAAHRQLANVTQVNFCALFVPAASIAVWILQHAPHLAQRDRLHILVAHAAEFQALDCGRWLRFIPRLLGRPKMQLELSLVGRLGLPESGSSPDTTESESDIRARLDQRFQSHAWAAVTNLAPAELHVGTVKSWSDLGSASASASRLPDLCAVFSPILSMNYPSLLSESELLPLLRARVAMAVFSSSEAEQLVDVYMLAAAGIDLDEPDCWPNPWSMPTPGPSARQSIFAKMAWSAASSHVPEGTYPDQQLVKDLASVLAYLEGSVESERLGPDAVLTLGEPLRAAALSSTDPDAVSVLLRLPHDSAVDSLSGHIYQLQDSQAILLDVNPVPSAILDAFPGDQHLLLRAMWATVVHRDLVQPWVQNLDAALVSQFSQLDEVALARRPIGRVVGAREDAHQILIAPVVDHSRILGRKTARSAQ